MRVPEKEEKDGFCSTIEKRAPRGGRTAELLRGGSGEKRQWLPSDCKEQEERKTGVLREAAGEQTGGFFGKEIDGAGE